MNNSIKLCFCFLMLVFSHLLYGQIHPGTTPLISEEKSAYKLVDALRTSLALQEQGHRHIPIVLDSMLISIDSLHKIPLKKVSSIALDFAPPPVAFLYGSSASRGTIVITIKKEEED